MTLQKHMSLTPAKHHIFNYLKCPASRNHNITILYLNFAGIYILKRGHTSSFGHDAAKNTSLTPAILHIFNYLKCPASRDHNITILYLNFAGLGWKVHAFYYALTQINVLYLEQRCSSTSVYTQSTSLFPSSLYSGEYSRTSMARTPPGP